MGQELKRLSQGILICFAILALVNIYWSTFQAEGIVAREDNPRQIAAEQRIQRGFIVDRNGILLAGNTAGRDENSVRRIYPYSRITGVTGYFSYQYGAGGLEFAFDDILRGDYGNSNAWEDLIDDLLHRPDTGYDLRSTLDLRIQQALAYSMETYSGAGIVATVPNGDILAMASYPRIDPDALDLTLDRFEAPENDFSEGPPIFNRATQGIYQPGTMMNIILLGAMLNEGDRLNRSTPGRTNPVILENLPPFNCLATPPQPATMTLRDAFAFACPEAFIEATDTTLTANNYETLLQKTGLLTRPELYRMQTVSGTSPTPLTRRDHTSEEAIAEFIGQGQLTITPLQMTRLMAAIANGGNAPVLHMADAYRLPEQNRWIPLPIPRRQPALLSQETAFQLQLALAYTAEVSPVVQAASRTDTGIRGYTLHGYSGNAISGENGLISWFAGYITLADNQSVVVVIVIENADSPEIAAQIAGDTFQSIAINY